MNHKIIKLIIVYEIYITAKVIKHKLIIVILKEGKDFRASVVVQSFYMR